MIAYLSCWANYSDSKACVKRAPVYNGHIFRNKRGNSQTPVENLYKEENLTRTRHCAKSKTLTLTKTFLFGAPNKFCLYKVDVITFVAKEKTIRII